MAYPRLSISECATYTASFDQDLAAYRAAGDRYPDSLRDVEPGELARRTVHQFRKVWDKRQAPAASR